MKVHLPAYPRGVHVIQESLGAEELRVDTTLFSGPIEVKVSLDRHDPYLEFDLNVETRVAATCDRCLSDFTWVLFNTSPMLYVLGRVTDTESVDDPGIVYLPANCTDVDLTADLRDLLILGLPSRYLCRDDCKGLCPHCGMDLNGQECTCGSVSRN